MLPGYSKRSIDVHYPRIIVDDSLQANNSADAAVYVIIIFRLWLDREQTHKPHLGDRGDVLGDGRRGWRGSGWCLGWNSGWCDLRSLVGAFRRAGVVGNVVFHGYFDFRSVLQCNTILYSLRDSYTYIHIRISLARSIIFFLFFFFAQVQIPACCKCGRKTMTDRFRPGEFIPARMEDPRVIIILSFSVRIAAVRMRDIIALFCKRCR